MATGKELPEGRVTFLFTDVEGSTRLLIVFETIGDAVYAAFAEPGDAVAAAAEAQRALAGEDWAPLEPIRVRMGLHSGPVERRGAHYFGPALYRCARLTSTAHGGQVVLSRTTAELAQPSFADGRLWSTWVSTGSRTSRSRSTSTSSRLPAGTRRSRRCARRPGGRTTCRRTSERSSAAAPSSPPCARCS